MSERATSAGIVESLAPDDPRLADAAHEWKSAYVHIPFCRRRCPYCDFAIVDESNADASHDRYVDALVAEIAMEGDFPALDAVNIGGGTPSTLSASQLSKIVEAIRDTFGILEGAEVSLELNPEDWTPDLGAALVEAGFTRVSIGAQSLDNAILGALGRSHSGDEVERAVEGARSVGFSSVGVDLILGHPREDDVSWMDTVGRALSLDVDHVSTYALTVEPGTELARQIRDGAAGPDDDTQADRYEAFVGEALERSIIRYEVSNHASAGHVCRYNLSTWAHGEYLGFGMAAHDHRWGRRGRNHRRLDRYLHDVEAGRRPRLGSELLDQRQQERDRLMLGLRLAAGTPITGVGADFLASAAAEPFIDAGVVTVVGDRIVVTRPLLADAVAREALSVSRGDC